jgi:rhodanese-related sulfurtransferase
MSNFDEVEPHHLHSLLEDNSAEIMLVDVRSPAEAAQGGIPGAQNVPLHLLPLHLERMPKDRDIVFYCHSGRRSAHACAFLAGQGWSRVVSLRGGMLNWVQAGKPVAGVETLSGAHEVPDTRGLN